MPSSLAEADAGSRYGCAQFSVRKPLGASPQSSETPASSPGLCHWSANLCHLLFAATKGFSALQCPQVPRFLLHEQDWSLVLDEGSEDYLR